MDASDVVIQECALSLLSLLSACPVNMGVEQFCLVRLIHIHESPP